MTNLKFVQVANKQTILHSIQYCWWHCSDCYLFIVHTLSLPKIKDDYGTRQKFHWHKLLLNGYQYFPINDQSQVCLGCQHANNFVFIEVMIPSVFKYLRNKPVEQPRVRQQLSKRDFFFFFIKQWHDKTYIKRIYLFNDKRKCIFLHSILIFSINSIPDTQIFLPEY